jgi:hypothetical protein
LTLLAGAYKNTFVFNLSENEILKWLCFQKLEFTLKSAEMFGQKNPHFRRRNQMKA